MKQNSGDTCLLGQGFEANCIIKELCCNQNFASLKVTAVCLLESICLHKYANTQLSCSYADLTIQLSFHM